MTPTSESQPYPKLMQNVLRPMFESLPRPRVLHRQISQRALIYEALTQNHTVCTVSVSGRVSSNDMHGSSTQTIGKAFSLAQMATIDETYHS